MESWPPGGLDPEIAILQETYIPSIAGSDMAGLLKDERLGRVAIVSSFGAESVILLHYVSGILPEVDVLFLDTGKHFPETLEYRDKVVNDFDLNLRVLTPEEEEVAAEDPDGRLHSYEPETCCRLRKVFPLQDALAGYDTWISGRKRYQAATRASMPVLERDGERIKINPLAFWSKEELDGYHERHSLPRHPLEAQNYLSIGCAPCTRAVKPGENARAGRWADTPDKTECGIHLGPDGRFRRSSKPS
ncbi:phosphoadenylylsulfate reductase (thioredoxin) [Salipiger thiooxidans]|uniref:Adenosine 5'-phosphosulfate reductase n=1 Tax=Salipiger thiooxidans TaxID=282683 RepID=A0A1G7LLQ4_9RHOB|nr:phosphoadenylyl-sulfate reductase [Salipiger thiooxidans]SDF50405.1 phosphoadenylylsulfate reductase (thioredoxin) [Salipiger thiooxidans]